MTSYGNISTSGMTFTLAGSDTGGERPKQPPKGLIVTQAVQTKAGWLGQVYVDKGIVFESASPHEKSDDAIDEANERVVTAVAKLFGETPSLFGT